MGEIHLRAEDIHPTVFGSYLWLRDGRRKKEYKFEGALMRRLGMYDPESGHSIAGTLRFEPDEEPNGQA